LIGLQVAEVEFKSQKQVEDFSPPEWFGKEATENEDYKNSSLALAKETI